MDKSSNYKGRQNLQNDEREDKTIDENPEETSLGALDSNPSPDFPAPIELAIPDQSQISEPDSGNEHEMLKKKIAFAAKATAIGILIGIAIGGIGFIRNKSSQGAMAAKLITSDTCLGANTIPSGFCFNSPVTVSLPPENPISELLGSHNTATISAPESRIGIFYNAALTLRLTGLSGASPTSNSSLKNTSVAGVTGTLSLAYSDLNRTLQSGSNNGGSIYYVGNNKIATKNQVSYQGQQISLVVISKIELKNNQLYLTPETVDALGRTAPASSVFSSVAPVLVSIATMPKGMKYQSLTTTKQALIFHLTGQNISLATLFTHT